MREVDHTVLDSMFRQLEHSGDYLAASQVRVRVTRVRVRVRVRVTVRVRVRVRVRV